MSNEINELRNIILNTVEPLIIKNSLNWDILKWDIDKWQQILGNESLQFRCGKNCYTKEPQFENTTDTVCMNFQKFLDKQDKNTQEWLYFDYKYLKDWLINVLELRKNISWKDFGFPEIGVKESTIWIGSKGAHTPCHIDTYGCNIIAQVYGRKRWMLFPPDENLCPTRIPYEESSIYSKINFFTPNADDFNDVSSCRTIVLNPGDVLVLPHRWWHYVENLELAISINTWIELPIDDEERISESITQTLISQLIKGLDSNVQRYFLNPNNTETNPLETSLWNCISVTHQCLQNNKYLEEKKESELRKETIEIKQILQKYKNIDEVDCLSKEDMKLLFENQRNRFEYVKSDLTITDDHKEIELLKHSIDAILHSDVINLIKEKLKI